MHADERRSGGILFYLHASAFIRGLFLILMVTAGVSAEERPRLLVLTDIGGDPDDQQSMVRLMYYANDFEIEGLIASASGTPGELKERVVKPQLIREIVEAYGKAQPNLKKHAEGYPEPGKLLGVIKSGNANRGREAVGEGQDTEGSRWIIQCVDRDDPRPLNITIWGGQTDLAQALWRVRKERGEAGMGKFVSRFRVYDINDQDKIVEWMWKEFPGMFYILASASPGRDKREGAYRGMYLGGDESLVSREWMEMNIRQGHGPLGALYPTKTWTAPNPHSAMKEGDTPSWFYFLPAGMNDPERPEWGSWGGRFERMEAGKTIYRDAKDTVEGDVSARATVWRWRPGFQGDFQARLDWGVTEEVKGANHAPVAVVNGMTGWKIVEVKAKAGERVELSAAGSSDRDGQAIRARWFIYREAGSYRDEVKLTAREEMKTSLVAPKVDQKETIHIILEVQDEGVPALRAYRRVVVVLEPGN